MFTGIIQELGKVKKLKKSPQGLDFFIESKKILKNKKIGDSISVNGVCLTVIKITGSGFQVQIVEETLSKTNLKDLKIGDEINLESALTLNQTLNGHLVQGHIDTEGTVENLNGKGDLTIHFPEDISCYLAFKGSITINGVSLTISNLQDSTFSVALIPHTLQTTNLKNLKKGDKVNLEVDLIARYLKNLLDKKADETKYEFLKDRNLI
ncbi:riboflavin synthase [Candidatus Peregrinibacteria bacterium]|nr:riboflavin synthase [Candidatus Peregrinibacteria bacterium]